MVLAFDLRMAVFTFDTSMVLGSRRMLVNGTVQSVSFLFIPSSLELELSVRQMLPTVRRTGSSGRVGVPAKLVKDRGSMGLEHQDKILVLWGS